MTLARPVYAIDKPLPLSKIGDLTVNLTALWGPDLRIEDLGGKFVFFTEGDRCSCRRCDSFLRELAQFDPFRMPSFMIVCPECGSKRCPRAADHTDECEVEVPVKPKSTKDRP